MEMRLLINGELVPGVGTLDVVNPATGRSFCKAPRADSGLLHEAVAAAKAAFPAWSMMPVESRAGKLLALAEALEQRAEDLARLLTSEQGKPLGDARVEVAVSVAALRHYAGHRSEERVISETASGHILEQRYPLGIVAVITPWNFPLLICVANLAPALITGNVVIAKPAPTTPLTTVALGEIAHSIVPAGVFQVLVDDNDLGSLLTSHPDISYISFTGSTPTGRKVLGSLADGLKRFTLELGGNDAAIVLDDANVDEIAPKLFAGAMVNSGQVCVAIKRVYAPRKMMDALCCRLGDLAADARVGNGLEEGTHLGPLQNRQQYDKVRSIIEEAEQLGVVVAGGNGESNQGYFISPTIIRDLPDSARLVCEEQFGPALPVLAYDDLDDAIARANSSELGLTASVWTSDTARGIEVASRLESGTVWVNKHYDLPFDVPFGGAKQSGIGRQHGEEGLARFTQPRIVNAAVK